MPLRVIGGTARGVALRIPPGARPTPARLRESLFGMLEAADAPFGSVIDLYAGSGALGIEALSRGAGRCLFVEAGSRARGAVRENLRRTGLAPRGEVAAGRLGRWRAPAGRRFGLVLADPPWGDAEAWAGIGRAVAGALEDGAVIAVEHPARAASPPALAGRPRWRERRLGDGAFAIYRRPAAAGEEAPA